MAPSVIHELCERYERNRESYRSDAYNEAQARQEFINPLFKQLGWDMDNEQGYAEAYKDVVHEDSLRVGTQLKAPDYGFRIGGQRKFFLEAKKPRVSVVDSKDPAYQLRRYAWSAKLPLSVLTNFAEFAVYDCRWKPEVSDAAGRHRVEYFTYEQFETKWEYLVNTFSRDAILKGSFDKYAQGMKGKRGTQEVDSEFLKEIELWREVLARNLRLRNKDLTIDDLNFSVGRIIDRIIFLRVCEDRGIEEYGQLESLLKGSNVYDGLVKLFKRADERYNSGLFHFQKEKGRGEQPDTLTPGLIVDDKILKDVLRTLYYPQSPYEFRVFPADILGQVYEQFLGKVIVKSGKTVDVEEKPEVRKAGGVYYTPTYIVDYIVKHTVGKLVEGKTPDEVSKLRVLDPACGSGSFLIGAYQYLLDWHLAYYQTPSPNPFPVNQTPSPNPFPVNGEGGPEPEQKKNRWKSIPKIHWQHAREMRKDATDAERFLWKALEKDKLGISFRRQHPVGPFVVDFFASRLGLVIEVDGGAHLPDNAKEYDAERDERMRAAGLIVLRFTNDDVLERLEWVLEEIRKQTPSPNPFPVNGEGESESELPSSIHGGRVGDGGLKKRAKNLPIYESSSGWRLTLSERKRILLNNIYGVDIDGQAVEVTKLSLLLKVLEGANAAEVQGELSFRHRALPDLSENIKCGNSLVGTDILKMKSEIGNEKGKKARKAPPTPPAEARGDLSAEEIARINPFDWHTEFKDVFKQGGFDAVIGNPPWGSLFSDMESLYLTKKFSSNEGELESQLFFIEHSLTLSKENGVVGLITPNTWPVVKNATQLRRKLLECYWIREMTEFTKYIFEDAQDMVPIVFFIEASPPVGRKTIVRLPVEGRVNGSNFQSSFFYGTASQLDWVKQPRYVISLRATEQNSVLSEKIRVSGLALCSKFDVVYGIKTGDNSSFVSTKQTKKHNVKALKTGELKRYQLNWKGLFLAWGKDLAGYRGTRVDVPKIVIQYIRKISLQRRIVAALDSTGEYYPLNNYSYVVAKQNEESIAYLLGIINSTMINFYFATNFVDYNIKPTYLSQLPIRTINFKDKADKARHDRMVKLVERMLELNKLLPEQKTPGAREKLSRQISATDREIDLLVYELYGLTAEEIAVVEGRPHPPAPSP